MNALRLALTLAPALTLAGFAQAQVVRTIVNNGPTSNRYDVVILGDGYRAVDQARFDQDCLTFAQGLFQKEPYRTFAGYFNVHTVFRASNDAGADHPDASPPLVRDTVYDATYNYGGTDRCLYIRNTSQALADAALAPANEGRVLVMVNDSRYGGCASTFAVSYNGAAMVEVQSHEVGHSIGSLADEYDYPNGTYTGGEPSARNLTTSSTGAKWSIWRGFDGISAFEGAGYYRFGLFRPRGECLMRNLNQPMCAVCGEGTVLKAYERVTPIENATPATTVVDVTRPNTVTFSFTNIAPAASNASITWLVENQPAQIGGTSFTFDPAAFANGSYRVVVEVVDRTPRVRNDPNNVLRKVRPWIVTVRDPARPDLRSTALTPTSATCAAGADIGIATTVENGGTASAGAFRVEHFLSLDTTIGTDDVHLGGYDVASLAAATSAPSTRPVVRIPAHVPPGNWHLAVWIDRGGAVVESDETNNVATTPVTVTTAACGPHLTFRDELVHPPDVATLSTTLPGAAVSPTVTAPCHPGALYLIAWSCSGTSPGTPLSPTVTLPLVIDGCTQLGLGLLNTPAFDAFYGTLDAAGVGRATLRLPGARFPGPIDTHLAAVVIAPDFSAFLGATPPVRVTLVR